MMQQYDKMILAILQGDDYHDAVHSLNEHGFYATVLNSSGGFLKKRSVTLMIGLESARLDEALAILKKHGERTEMRYEAPVLSPNMPPIPLSTAPLEIPTRCWTSRRARATEHGASLHGGAGDAPAVDPAAGAAAFVHARAAAEILRRLHRQRRACPHGPARPPRRRRARVPR